MNMKLTLFVAIFFLFGLSVQGCSRMSSASSVTSSTSELNDSAGSAFAAFVENEGMTSEVGNISNSQNITITKDEGSKITYEIASSLDSGGSTITFHFDERGANKSSVRADIDVPPVARGTKYLSEIKIRNAIDKSLKAFAEAFNREESVASALRDINSTVLLVEIATNSTNEGDDMRLVLEMMEDGEEGEAEFASAQFRETEVSDTSITGKPSMDLEENSDYGASQNQEDEDYTADEDW
jgi:hypothetical protein